MEKIYLSSDLFFPSKFWEKSKINFSFVALLFFRSSPPRTCWIFMSVVNMQVSFFPSLSNSRIISVFVHTTGNKTCWGKASFCWSWRMWVEGWADGQMEGYFTVPQEKICPHMETIETVIPDYWGRWCQIVSHEAEGRLKRLDGLRAELAGFMGVCAMWGLEEFKLLLVQIYELKSVFTQLKFLKRTSHF